jgi:phosphatidylglycerol:prolipoprotein diacylglycerol transferase
MFPEIFKIPFTNFPLNTYGLLLALSFVLGLWLTSRLAGKDGLDSQKVYDLGLWVLAASLVGSKVLLIITEWDSDPRSVWARLFSLDFLLSAGVFYGGFLGAVLASVIVMRKYKLPWWRTADAFAPGIAIGQAVGRLGCFSAGCCWGKPTTAFCGVHFSDRGHEVTGVPTIVGHLSDPIQQNVWAEKLGGLTAPLHLHPTQLYESAVMFLLTITLVMLFRRRQFYGQIILLYAMLYAVARFVIEIWRDDPRGELLGMSTSQFIAVLLFAASALTYIIRARKPRIAREAATA